MDNAASPQPNEACEDPGPRSALERLETAIGAIDTAVGCLDLQSVAWVPPEPERWKHAGRLLREAREELQAASAAWTGPGGQA